MDTQKIKEILYNEINKFLHNFVPDFVPEELYERRAKYNDYQVQKMRLVSVRHTEKRNESYLAFVDVSNNELYMEECSGGPHNFLRDNPEYTYIGKKLTTFNVINWLLSDDIVKIASENMNREGTLLYNGKEVMFFAKSKLFYKDPDELDRLVDGQVYIDFSKTPDYFDEYNEDLILALYYTSKYSKMKANCTRDFLHKFKDQKLGGRVLYILTEISKKYNKKTKVYNNQFVISVNEEDGIYKCDWEYKKIEVATGDSDIETSCKNAFTIDPNANIFEQDQSFYKFYNDFVLKTYKF